MRRPPPLGATHANNSATHHGLNAHHSNLVLMELGEQKAPRASEARRVVSGALALCVVPKHPAGASGPKSPPWSHVTAGQERCQATVSRQSSGGSYHKGPRSQ